MLGERAPSAKQRRRRPRRREIAVNDAMRKSLYEGGSVRVHKSAARNGVVPAETTRDAAA